MTTTAPVGRPVPTETATVHWRWIYRRRTDLVLALCWLPAYWAVHQLTSGEGATTERLLRDVVHWTLLLSLLHQPLTLLLVYGDPAQFRTRRALFAWSPPVAIVLVGLAVGLDLWIVVPVAAIWNTVHTVQQRYGLCRIYARKSGYGDARLDRLLLFTALGAAIVVAGASRTTEDQLGRIALGATNREAVEALTSIRPYAAWLVVPAVALALGVLLAVVRQEWRERERANHAKWLYQGATLALVVGIMVDPLAGLVAWVLAHTVEYLVVVQRTMVSRYAHPDGAGCPLGRLGGGRRRWLLLAAFLGLFFVAIAQLRANLPERVYLSGLYTVGVLHFWYDAFIWKVRKPSVAQVFAIRS